MSFNKKPKTINPDEVDPSVYYYDEVYDEMKDEESNAHRECQSDDKKTKQGSKYIQGIIETADRRKSEKEIRKFRKYARDREEAEATGDLESIDVYVSKSYERKLKEVHDAFRKQSKPDDNLELNSFKRHKKDDRNDHKTSQTRSEQPSTSMSDSTDETVIINVATEPTSLERNSSTRKKPKTLEERREYLREVLKKQTVGEVFEAALQRYKQRKALAS